MKHGPGIVKNGPKPNEADVESVKPEYVVIDDEFSVVKDGSDEVLREPGARVNTSFLGSRVQRWRIEKSAKSKNKRYTEGQEERLKLYIRES